VLWTLIVALSLVVVAGAAAPRSSALGRCGGKARVVSGGFEKK